MRLTKRQVEILSFLTRYTKERGYSPSYQEIAMQLGVRSLSTVYEHVEALISQGRLRRIPRSPRSLEVVEGTPHEPYITVRGVRYVAVTELPRLFREWMKKRQMPLELAT